MNKLVLLAVLAVTAGGVAQAQELQKSDPWEPFNRSVFSFNEKVDAAILSPVAHGYRAITPRFFRTGVTNVLQNLRAPVTLANDVLQVAPVRAGVTVARFGINSTIGLAGAFDVATSMGIEGHSEDFGQTLGRWGVGSGPYLVLPLMGPSSLRDAPGNLVDLAFNPLNYARFDGDDAFRISRGVLGTVSAREGAIEAIDSVYATAIDPYVSIRTTYGLLREGEVRNGRTDVQDLPDFEETPSDAEPASQPADPTVSP